MTPGLDKLNQMLSYLLWTVNSVAVLTLMVIAAGFGLAHAGHTELRPGRTAVKLAIGVIVAASASNMATALIR